MNESLNDIGHQKLVEDIEALYQEVMDFRYHDCAPSSFAAPKIRLEEVINDIRSKIIIGEYDNICNNV